MLGMAPLEGQLLAWPFWPSSFEVPFGAPKTSWIHVATGKAEEKAH